MGLPAKDRQTRPVSPQELLGQMLLSWGTAERQWSTQRQALRGESLKSTLLKQDSNLQTSDIS